MNLRHSRWGAVAGTLLSGILLLGACDGENLFDPKQNPFTTPQVSLSAPAGAFAGDTISVSVSASAASELASIDVSVRGAVVKDTSITVPALRNASATVKIVLPLVLTDTLLFVSATATDRLGNVSRVRADTIALVGPPSILSITGPDSLRAGTTSTLNVRAFGTRRITQLAISLRGAVNSDQTIILPAPVNDVNQSFNVTIPALVSDTTLRVSVVARDVSGLSSPAGTATLPLAIQAPTVAFTTIPANATPGGLLNLSVNATAMRQVQRIRIELVGVKDTTITLLAPATTVNQDISIRLPSDITTSTITVRAFAFDRANVISQPAVAVVAMNSGLPAITAVTCISCTGPAADSVRAGGKVDIMVEATSTRPLTEITVLFRGAVDQEVRVQVPASPPRTSFKTPTPISVQIPAEVADTILTVTAIATDGIDVSLITPLSVKRIRVADVNAPVVTASATPASVFAGGTVLIRVNARDNVSVRRIGYAVVNPAGDTIGVTPTLVNTSGAIKDTTFSFNMPSTITPRTVRVFGVAEDASGRRGLSAAVQVVVADSAAPTITFLTPTPNATLPLNDSVRVQIRAVDPTGIRSIRLRGESVRVDSLGPTRTIQRFAEKIITFPATPGQPFPTDTTVIRYLLAIPDSISEPVSIIATATDSLGNSSSVSTTIFVGGPRVELRNPINNSQVVPGGTLLLTAFALDRTAGIDSVKINITGAQTQTFSFTGLASNDSVVINQNYVVGPALGTMTVTATAWNRNRISGTSSPVTVLVSSTAIIDNSPPQVRVAMSMNDRIELTDTIALNVSAQDIGAAGLRRVGVVVLALPGGLGVAPDTLYRDSVFTGSGRTGIQPAAFKFTLKDFGYNEVNLIRLPRNMTFQVHAFAVDTAGNCGASVTNTMTSLPCDSIMPPLVPAGEKWFIARNTPGLSQLASVVPGFAQPLPSAGSVIADLVVDNLNPLGPRMYMSNHNFNRIEVLNLQDSTFAPAVSVGSEPWGMFVNNGNDRLIVANSGGTNISMVDITLPVNQVAEVPGDRILTPNAVLFDVAIGISNGLTRYLVTAHDFSDRPQFVAQDNSGIILYSTKPTGAAPDGTVRYLTNPSPERDSKILFNRNAIVASADGLAVAHVDSIVVQRNATTDDLVNIFDHVPGDPTAVISSGGFFNLQTAVANVRAAGSDIADFSGVWDLGAVGLSDTTFVTASRDRQFIGFGEGSVGPGARVWLWRTASQSISDDITVADLVNNTNERVLGIALNNNGTLGAARGATSTYFFSNNTDSEGDLRLQGIFSNGVAGGNGGVALHPDHSFVSLSNATTLAFVATVNRSIKIVDTFHFRERGEILIRDNIVGPLRATVPFANENIGLSECDEIWVKLFGVTGTGKAVIINVRKKDVVNPIITAAACPT